MSTIMYDNMCLPKFGHPRMAIALPVLLWYTRQDLHAGALLLPF